MFLLLLTSVRAQDTPRFEAEFLQGLRDQTISAEIEPDVVAIRRHLGITTGVRLRAEAPNARWGVEVHGAGDWRALGMDVRPERYGGLRGLLGVQGRTPLTQTVAHLRLGMVAQDLADLADLAHRPFHMATLGLDVRRLTRTSLQELQLDGLLGEGAMGFELRGRFGTQLGSGWYLTLGISTNRFGRVPGSEKTELRQVTYQVEGSLLFLLPHD